MFELNKQMLVGHAFVINNNDTISEIEMSRK